MPDQPTGQQTPRLIQIKSFTAASEGRLRVLVTFVRIFPNPVSNPQEGPEFKAIWDTGATNSCISNKIVSDLNLKPIGKTRMASASGENIHNVFLVAVWLPNNVEFPRVQVTECVLKDADMLIGMDIIGSGDFAVTNKDGKTVFTYRFPSVERIDFVEKKIPQPKIHRNALCLCGSGKKFKKCCGK